MKSQTLHLGLAFLRIASGLMLLTHGIPKLEKLFEVPVKFADPLGFGAMPSLILALIGEVVAPILVIIGFKTKWATIPVIITMLVAVFVVHLEDPFGRKELGLLYLFSFLTIYFTGPGKYSIDGKQARG